MEVLPNEILEMMYCDNGITHQVCKQWYELFPSKTISVPMMLQHENYMVLLSWAWQNGCPKTPELYHICVKYKRWQVIRWLRSQGVRWNDRVCDAFAANDHDTCVWASTQVWITSNQTLLCAIRGDSIPTVKFLWEAGVRVLDVMQAVADVKSVAMLEYLDDIYPGIYNNMISQFPQFCTADMMSAFAAQNMPVKHINVRVVKAEVLIWLYKNGYRQLLTDAYPMNNLLRSRHKKLIKLAVQHANFNHRSAYKKLIKAGDPIGTFEIMETYRDLNYKVMMKCCVGLFDYGGRNLLLWINQRFDCKSYILHNHRAHLIWDERNIQAASSVLGLYLDSDSDSDLSSD